MQLLDRIPYTLLIVFAILMALLPFGSSHLLEKSRMLLGGTLRRPLDWFDLFWHSIPLILLTAKVVAHVVRGSR